jgi:tetratricopeptide (TPR) repeat protein
MRRLFWIAIAALVVLAGGMMLMARTSRSEWTTSSKEALREFQLGREAQMKLYFQEARDHYAKAVELDPDFVVARMVMTEYGEDKEALEPLVAELRELDLRRLNERERFLVRRHLARHDEQPEEVERLLTEFRAAAPNDPYGLAAYSARLWEQQDWERAEEAYQRLLEADPNWVIAQNHLGYMAMARGQFAEAENLFTTYRFIAPDQANPHDSMGELMTLLGRYEEARRELEEAIRIRPDFCYSYMHLLDIAILEGRPYEAYPILERAEEHCEEEWVDRERCDVTLWSDFLAGDLDSPWREERRECVEKIGSTNFLIHRMAAGTGRWEEALAIEEALSEQIGEMEITTRVEGKARIGMLHHMKGVRLLAQGEIEAAIEEFREADTSLFYWGESQGILKLFNRLNLAAALEEAERPAEAQATIEGVRKVNSPFADAFAEIKECFRS